MLTLLLYYRTHIQHWWFIIVCVCRVWVLRQLTQCSRPRCWTCWSRLVVQRWLLGGITPTLALVAGSLVLTSIPSRALRHCHPGLSQSSLTLYRVSKVSLWGVYFALQATYMYIRCMIDHIHSYTFHCVKQFDILSCVWPVQKLMTYNFCEHYVSAIGCHNVVNPGHVPYLYFDLYFLLGSRV